MAGVTTDVCLIFPAIDAAKEGFEVQAVIDASGSPSELSEEFVPADAGCRRCLDRHQYTDCRTCAGLVDPKRPAIDWSAFQRRLPGPGGWSELRRGLIEEENTMSSALFGG